MNLEHLFNLRKFNNLRNEYYTNLPILYLEAVGVQVKILISYPE